MSARDAQTAGAAAQRAGAIASDDAAGRAHTDAAIEQAHRAAHEVVGLPASDYTSRFTTE